MKKSSRSLTRGEIVFVAVILACLAAAAALLANVKPAHGTAPGMQVGTVTFKNHFAGRKLSNEVIWDDLPQNAPVYNLDSIRTGRNSTAIVHLDQRVDISLGEESLILLDLAPAGARLSVTGGSVVVRMSGPRSPGTENTAAPLPVVLSTSSGQVSLNSGTLSVADTNAGLNVSLTDGDAVFSNDSGSQAMTGSAVLGTSGRIVPAPGLRLLEPADGDALLTAHDNALVQFRWQELNPAPQGSLLTLTVASDRAFTQIETRTAVRGSQSSVDVPPGTHYWRVSSSAHPDAASTVSWFTVQAVTAPRLIAPRGRSFSVDAGKVRSVSFSWTPSSAAAAYRVEIAPRYGSAPALSPITTTLSSVTVDVLGEGDYSWKVTALAGAPAFESQSETGTFSVIANAPQVPDIRGAEGHAGSGSDGSARAMRVSTVAVRNGAVIATWDEVDGADHYVATISRDGKGADVADTVATRSSFLQLGKALDKGTYYVRVQAVTEASFSSPSSSLRLDIVDAAPPDLIEPRAGTRLDPTTRDVRFKWSDPNQGHLYRLQVAGDQGFTSPIADTVIDTTQSAVITLPDNMAGNLEWKVALLDEQKGTLVESAAAAVFLPKLLASLRIISPADGSEIDINEVDKILFQWEPVAEADVYQVVLYRTAAGLRSPAQSWRTVVPRVVLDRFEGLAIGSFAWQVRAVSGPLGAARGQSRPVDSYFRLIQSSPLPAPSVVIKGNTFSPPKGR